MVVWWQSLQLTLVTALIIGMVAVMNFLHSTERYAYGWGVIVISAVVATLLVAWILTIETNIRARLMRN